MHRQEGGPTWRRRENLRKLHRIQQTHHQKGELKGRTRENVGNLTPESGEAPGEGEPLGRTMANLAQNPADKPPREGEPLGRTLREPWENLRNLSRESGRRATRRVMWQNTAPTIKIFNHTANAI